ncbi:hypothetical protein [Paraburkholderia sp. PGU19]|uniref:hypothetical protein n=1 Tax=Paraburkholderia sp. PGU19 TaxID=2735434 RepID=UPI001FB087D4|nr:hypothetical protein [Paraburkholderia sp. PGU19]
MKPRAIFAAAVDDGDPSERSQETVTPLFEYLKTEGPVDFVTTHQKTDHQGLIDDLLQHNGIVLVAWEHKQIPALIACLPDAPVTPTEWPDSRLYVTLVLDQNAGGWRFSQVPQLLLAGDSPAPIE